MGWIYWKFAVVSILVVSVHVIRVESSHEPRCSEFHFLESLLEKLVRMENKMDSMHSDTQKEITLVREKVAALESTAKNVEENMKSLEQTATELDDDLRKTDEKLAELDAGLTQNLKTQEELVEHHRQLQAYTAVAFLARLNAPVRNLQQGSVVKFNVVLSNIGDGYNPDTGYFIAPVSGIYMFSVSAMSDVKANGWIELFIVKNADLITGAYGYPGVIGHDQGATTAFIEVAANDKIWVKVNQPTTNASVGGWKFSSFSGCLFHQL